MKLFLESAIKCPIGRVQTSNYHLSPLSRSFPMFLNVVCSCTTYPVAQLSIQHQGTFYLLSFLLPTSPLYLCFQSFLHFSIVIISWMNPCLGISTVNIIIFAFFLPDLLRQNWDNNKLHKFRVYNMRSFEIIITIKTMKMSFTLKCFHMPLCNFSLIPLSTHLHSQAITDLVFVR